MPPVPVLLLTDIGRDIDDLLALLVLRGLVADGRAVLVGVVATGGAGPARAALARAWLRRLQWPDEPELGVAACLDPGPDEVSAPAWATNGCRGNGNGNDGIDRSPDDAAGLILRCAARWGPELVVLAIAPLGPLAAALVADKAGVLRTIRAVWIQGQPATMPMLPHIPPHPRSPHPHPHPHPPIEPDLVNAFNLRERPDASATVFARLRLHVPFRLLGKHAAYKTPLSHRDFRRCDAALGSHGCCTRHDNGSRGPSTSLDGPVDGELTEQARDNLAILLAHSPEIFERLYGGRRDDPNWFKHLGFLSNPYDALLVLAAFEPGLFDWKSLPRSLDPGNTPHLVVGDTPDHHGVRRPRQVKRRLVALLLRGAECTRACRGVTGVQQ